MTTAAATADATTLDTIRATAGELLAHDRWTREQLLELRREMLTGLLAHAVAHSAYYRETLGRDAADADLVDLPTLSKATLMEQFDRVVTDPALRLADLEAFVARARPGERYRGRYHVFATSGATGAPGLFVFSDTEFPRWTSVGLAALARVGVGPDTRLVAIGAPAEVHITRQVFAVLQAGRSGVPQLNVTMPVAQLVDELNRYGPEAMLSYASVLAILAEEQLEGRLAIAPRVTIATSEVLTDEAARLIEAAWGHAPLNAYAATEAPGMAFGSLDDVGMLVAEDSIVLEVVDRDGNAVEPGTPGAKVLLTNLVNHAQPLIRYELSDSVVLAPGEDPGGRPYLRIARVDGRSDDILRFGDVHVHPHRLRAPFTTLLDVRQYQIVHRRDGSLQVDVVPRRPAAQLPERVKAALEQALAQAGATDVPIRVDIVAAIEREGGHAAKLKLIRAEA